MPQDTSNHAATSPRPRRERSTRHPGVPLAEGLKLCESIVELGVDGLSASDIALALGYKNIKTNTFSARLSAARQFGLLALTADGYALTPLALEILHPVEPDALPRLYRQALLKPPLYAELSERLAGKKVPEPAILGNILYHSHQIIASAKKAAAEAFLESARFAGALGDDQVFLPNGPPELAPPPTPASKNDPAAPAQARAASSSSSVAPAATRGRSSDVRLDLRLWDRDDGKTIRLRAPQSITPASFERFLQAFRLLVRVEEPPPGDSSA
jgi:hypothetical protein